MRRGAAWASLGASLLLMWSSLAHGQCTKDTDCKGDRVCEGGQCTAPATPVPPPAAAATPAPAAASEPATAVSPAPTVAGAAASAPPPAEPGAAAGTAPAPAAAAAPIALSQPAPAPAMAPLPVEEATQRRSRSAMIIGIVLASVAPLALLGSVSAVNDQADCDRALEDRYPNHIVPPSEKAAVERCDEYTTTAWVLGLGGAAMLAAGVPLIIYGAKPMPVGPPPAQARLLPWASPTGGGMKLRLDL